ncbi:MAG: DUF1850 domain-containing protein [Deltaproteobacteria bacterium]|nr:DUF1850 domain-containing protein [Deltaproteobacteria bacterium]
MKKRFWWPAVIIFFLFWGGEVCFSQPLFVLEVKDYKNDRNLLQVGIPSQELIYLRTIHSLALTPYTHIFKFDKDGNLILSGAIFESGGGGFPEKGDGVWSVVDGKFRVDQMNRYVGQLRFRVSTLSKETLIVSHREFPLYQMVPEGTLVELKVKKGVHFDPAAE